MRFAAAAVERAVVDPFKFLVAQPVGWLGREIIQDVKALAGDPAALSERIERANRQVQVFDRVMSGEGGGRPLAQVIAEMTPEQREEATRAARELAKAVTIEQWNALKRIWRQDPWKAAGVVTGEALLWFGPALYRAYRSVGDLRAAAKVAEDLRTTTSFFGERPEAVARMAPEVRVALQRAERVAAEAEAEAERFRLPARPRREAAVDFRRIPRAGPEDAPPADLAEALRRRTVDTAAVQDERVFGRAARLEGRKVLTQHVTDNPENVLKQLKAGAEIQRTGRSTGMDAFGRALYASDVPEMWSGRSSSQFRTVEGLSADERRRLAGVFAKHIEEQARSGYITRAEAEIALRDLDYFVRDEDATGMLATILNQPYNLRVTDDVLKEARISRRVQTPSVVEMELEGRFVDLTDLDAHSERQLWEASVAWARRNGLIKPSGWRGSLGESLTPLGKAVVGHGDVEAELRSAYLRSLGYDGAFFKQGFSTTAQVGIWNPNAVRRFGTWRNPRPLRERIVEATPRVEEIDPAILATARDIRAAAEPIATRFLRDVRAASTEAGGRFVDELERYVLKSETGIARKLARGRTPTDIVRATVEIRDPVGDPRRFADALRARGYEIVEETNRWTDPRFADWAYKDVAFKIRRPGDPVVQEVILITPAMLAQKMKNGGHAIYEVLRRVDDLVAEYPGDDAASRRIKAWAERARAVLKQEEARLYGEAAALDASASSIALPRPIRLSTVSGEMPPRALSKSSQRSVKGLLKSLSEARFSQRSASSEVQRGLRSLLATEPAPLPIPIVTGQATAGKVDQALLRRQQLVARIEELTKDRGRLYAQDMPEHDRLVKEIAAIDRQHKFGTAARARTGEPITIPQAVRAGDPEGVFYADRHLPAFGARRTERPLTFRNPAVFDRQMDAVEAWFGKDVRRRLEDEARIISQGPLADLAEKVADPRVQAFYRRVDRMLIDEALRRGHDGIIYHHGRKPLDGEYVDLTRLRAAAERAPAAALPARAVGPAAVSPQKFRAETPTGLAVEGDYAVVSARDLITSHDTSLRVNPQYPEIRQPRMRDKAASQQQLDNFVKNTRVEALGRSDDAARGAPIVDGLEADRYGGYLVDSGNMRAIGIQKLYELKHPNAERYREFVRQEARALGIPDEAVDAVPDPVLVRVRRTPVDVVRFNRESNLGTQLKMSAVEVARADAQMLDEGLLALYRPSETGEVATAANRDFIARFIHKVAPIPEERGDLLLPDGSLTRQGIQRVQNALLAKAYGDVAALEKLIESPDINVRNLANAMLQAAPRLIELQNRIERGERHALAVGEDVAQAMNLLSRLREEGTPVELYIQQTRLFGEEVSREALRLLEIFDANKASRKRIAEFLSTYADMVDALGDPKQVQLVARQLPTKLDLINQAADLARERPTALFDVMDAMRAETAANVARQQETGAVRLPAFVQAPATPAVKAADTAVEAVETARLRPADFLSGVRRWWDRFVERAVHPLVYEPLLRDRPDLRNRFRLLKAIPQQAVEFGRDAVFAVRGDLNPQEYEVFRRWILQKSFQQDLAAGLRVPGNLAEAQVSARLAELEAQFTPAVRRAVERHRNLTKALAADLVGRGILPPEALQTDIYFPHRVLDYQQVFGDWIGLPRRLRAPYRSYARTRKGTVSFINTDYDQVMAEHIGQVFVHNKLDDFWRSVARTENVLGRLSREQKAALFGTDVRTVRGRQVRVVRQPLPNRVYVIDGKEYVGFQYDPGRQAYPALTTTEKLVQAVIDGTINAEEYADRIRRGFALGRHKPVVLLPRTVYERLMRFKQPYVPLPVLDQIAGFTNLWKGVTLNLVVPASYNINNEIGDFLGSIAREIPWQELWKELPRIYWYRLQATAPVFKRVVRGKPLAELGPEWERILRLAEENDVIASGLAAGKTRAADMLRLLNPMALTQAFAEVQEASRRAGYYKWLLERSARGQPLALSVPATELAQLRGAGEAAGYVARTVLVDYQATSPTFRRFVNNLAFPFATWYAYNFINYAKYVRRNPADALVKLLVPYVGMQLWNNTVWGDVEKDLPLYYRLMPHIVTGRTDADGKHIVIVFQHPAHFAAQLVGLDRLGDNVRRLRAGELTLEEFAYQQLKDTALGTPRMMWRFLNPIAKIGLVMGQYYAGSGNVRDIVTQRVIVPERLRGTPEARDRLMGYVAEQVVVPLAQVYRAGREDDPAPDGWAAKWAKEALDLEQAAGIRRIDVDRAAQFRRRDWQEQLEAIRASALDKLEQAYVRASVERDPNLYERGAQEAQAWYRAEVARAWRQMGGKGTPPAAAFRPEEVQSRLSSTRVRIAITREMLRRERDPERRRRLFAALEALDRKAADEARKRAPKGIRDLVPTPIPTR